MTCHQPNENMTVSARRCPGALRGDRRYRPDLPDERRHSNSPRADVSTVDARRSAYSMLLAKARYSRRHRHPRERRVRALRGQRSVRLCRPQRERQRALSLSAGPCPPRTSPSSAPSCGTGVRPSRKVRPRLFTSTWPINRIARPRVTRRPRSRSTTPRGRRSSRTKWATRRAGPRPKRRRARPAAERRAVPQALSEALVHVRRE